MQSRGRGRARRGHAEISSLDQHKFGRSSKTAAKSKAQTFKHRTPKQVDLIEKSSTHWRSLKSRAAHLRKKEGLTPIESDLLAARGLRAGKELKQFLSPDFEKYINQRNEVRNLKELATKLVDAALAGKRIALAFDYDADGASSGAQLAKLLDHLGIRYAVVGSDRFNGGYGLSEQMVDRANRKRADLIVAMDIGTSNNPSLEHARSLGMETLVVDHHDIPKDFQGSKADVIVNPRFEECGFEGGKPCAAGLTMLLGFEVVAQIAQRGPKSLAEKALSFDTGQLIQMATLGTIADQVELVGFNRALVKEGLRLMEEKPDYWVKALGLVSGAGINVSASDIAFQFGPRINAPGRLIEGEERPGVEKSFELLRARNRRKAETYARELNEINVKRRTLERATTRRLLEKLSKYRVLPPALLFAEDDIHPGVAGIVCSRIVEETNRPVFVVTKNAEGEWTGSGRTVPGVPLKETLDEFGKLLTKYGGHPQAAGLTFPAENLEKVRKALRKSVKARIGTNGVSPKQKAHIIMSLPDLVAQKDEVFEAFQRIEPSGRGNPSPLIQFTGATVVETDLLKDRHMTVLLQQGGAYIRGLMWHTEEHPEIEAGAKVDIVAWPKIEKHSKFDRSKDELVLELRAVSRSRDH